MGALSRKANHAIFQTSQAGYNRACAAYRSARAHLSRSSPTTNRPISMANINSM